MTLLVKMIKEHNEDEKKLYEKLSKQQKREELFSLDWNVIRDIKEKSYDQNFILEDEVRLSEKPVLVSLIWVNRIVKSKGHFH